MVYADILIHGTSFVMCVQEEEDKIVLQAVLIEQNRVNNKNHVLAGWCSAGTCLLDLGLVICFLNIDEWWVNIDEANLFGYTPMENEGPCRFIIPLSPFLNR